MQLESAAPHLKEDPEYPKVAMSEMLPLLEKICVEEFGAVRKATPSANPQNASRWKINKSAQYTKGAPKAVLDASYVESSVTMFDDPNTVARKVSMSVASTSYVNTAIFTLGELVPENVAESMLNLPLV